MSTSHACIPLTSTHENLILFYPLHFSRLFKCVDIVSQEKENSFLSFKNADVSTSSKFKIVLEE